MFLAILRCQRGHKAIPTSSMWVPLLAPHHTLSTHFRLYLLYTNIVGASPRLGLRPLAMRSIGKLLSLDHAMELKSHRCEFHGFKSSANNLAAEANVEHDIEVSVSNHFPVL
ncbi:uncharacterized protein RSE6_02049 [Rhynchosporium secalis]|uniref:Uncharacterized protein n=1 Tax=Rhynchosporium secalis TaxID=38038 RepID=A0A1E1LZA1_RHYSE|nr:uncharacterized protein RSE6_02049 [Rhynchosporium secalis]